MSSDPEEVPSNPSQEWLVKNGGVLLVLEFPVGSYFGIDKHVWQVGRLCNQASSSSSSSLTSVIRLVRALWASILSPTVFTMSSTQRKRCPLGRDSSW